MVNGVAVSAAVFAEATQRQVRLRASSYDGTRRREKTIQTIEASLNANNLHLDNQIRFCGQD